MNVLLVLAVILLLALLRITWRMRLLTRDLDAKCNDRTLELKKKDDELRRVKQTHGIHLAEIASRINQVLATLRGLEEIRSRNGNEVDQNLDACYKSVCDQLIVMMRQLTSVNNAKVDDERRK